MTFTWTLTAGFLYAMMGVISVLMLPFIPATFWSKLIKSTFVENIKTSCAYTFRMSLLLLALMFVEGLRDSWNKNTEYHVMKSKPEQLRPDAEALVLMRLFRSQRNLHIAGFAIFTWFVFQMLIKLLIKNAQMQACQEASIKQAKSATETAQRLMTSSGDSETKKPLEALKKLLEAEQEDHKKTKLDLEAMKKQSEQLTKEYDRVTEECRNLEAKLRASAGSVADKKSD